MFSTIGKVWSLLGIFIDALHDLVNAGRVHSALLRETSEADVEVKRMELADKIQARKAKYIVKAEARKLEPVTEAA